MSERYEIDFYKELKLPRTTCGLVNKILSPKGKRRLNERNEYEYHLNDELIQVYQGEGATEVTEGLYWVMDVFKNSEGQLQWNHYLVVVDEEGFYPIYEYLDAHDTTWILDAMPYIKGYFAGEEFDPIALTKYRMPKPKTRWSKIK